MRTKTVLIAFFIISLTNIITAQIVYEPLFRDVYDFLSRLSQRGVIEYQDVIKPLPRKYIAEKLNEASEKLNQLTNLEKEELKFYKQDFYNELNFGTEDEGKELSYLSKDAGGRYRLFSYSDDFFKVNLSPILGYSYGKNDGRRANHSWNGVYFYGYLSDNIGFSFDFRDNDETGKGIDRSKSFTPVTGVTVRNFPNSIQYSEARTTLSADWDWASVTIGKDFLEWGYAENGRIVLSNKAPSFPFIRLDIQPVEWLRFNYIHAWLASNVIDSTIYYSTRLEGNIRFLYREKFLASHTLTVTPFKGLDISLGESIIYSDRLEIGYLIPISFFRLVDHYLSRQNNRAGSNAQFFFALSSRNHVKNTHLYGTVFIDEITLNKLFDKAGQRNQFGFTLGGSVTDLPVDNLSVTLEFTKIFPFVYNHFIPTQTYESASYSLGHWMGYNADLVYAALRYRIIRGLNTKVWAQYIRKGGQGETVQQYEQPQPPFLFGLRNNYTYLGFSAKYEIIHELFAAVEYQHTKIEQQQDDLSFINSSLNEFSFAFYYGL